MNHPTKLLYEIRKKAFPELEGIEIKVRYKKQDTPYFEVSEGEKGYDIDIHPCMRKAPRIVLTGGLCHELAHIAIDEKKSSLGRLVFIKIWMVSRKYRVWDERNADALAVQKGFAKELLAFSRWCDEQEKDKDGELNPESGLTTQELEKLVLEL